jgi:type II secretion system protein I
VNKGGFTLIEIMVALVVFSLVFLPLTALLVAESKFEANYRRKQVALMVAKNEIEKCKRSFGATRDDGYTVVMAGKPWEVRRSVEECDPAAITDSTAIRRMFITVRVSRDRDTTALAELRVMREAYR